MGTKTVHVSDFSGRILEPGDEVVRIVVIEHPDLIVGPVQLEATPDEIESIDDASLDVAVVEIVDGRGGSQPRRVVLTASEFDSLATDVPMSQLLRTAEPVRAAKPVKRAGSKVDYGTLEHAGKPHRGRITDEEAQLVRDHLDEINKRLAEEGLRPIDPNDPEHAERYGFPAVEAPAGGGSPVAGASGAGASGAGASGAGASGVDGSGVDGSGVDGSGVDGSGVDWSGVDGSGTDVPALGGPDGSTAD